MTPRHAAALARSLRLVTQLAPASPRPTLPASIFRTAHPSSRLLSTARPPAPTPSTQFPAAAPAPPDIASHPPHPHPIAPSPADDPATSLESASTLASAASLSANTGAAYLEHFHNALSLHGSLFPWAPSIILSAFAIRLVSLPLVYYNQVHAGRFALAAKELPRVQAFVRQTPGSLWQKYRTFRRLRALTLRSAGTSATRLFRWDLLVHLPVVVSASMGIRTLAASAPEAWRTGGLAWFPDLTLADPTGALPVVTTALWLWNSNPRSALRQTAVQGEGDDAKNRAGDDVGKGGAGRRNAVMERIMSSRGEWVSTLLQIVAVASLTVTMDLPSGIVLLWASNGTVTALQRWMLSNDSVRRRVGLLTTEDIARASGPPVLPSTKVAVEQMRRELQYVQREMLARFPNRGVDTKLRNEVNRLLERERWGGRISMQLEAVIREDDRNGKKYIAVVKKGAS